MDAHATMAGKENGAQSSIRQQYPKAVFVHCSSHRLNLVTYDLNKLPAIRNTVGIIKCIIKFFRESPNRRALIPSTQLLYETRWTAKYKSIYLFRQNFIDIHTSFITKRIISSNVEHMLLSFIILLTIQILLYV